MDGSPRRTRLFTIVGGAAAAATAAFVASKLGVAGTIVGAAVASIVASIGAEVYGQAVRRSAEAMTALALRNRAMAAGGDPAEPDDGMDAPHVRGMADDDAISADPSDEELAAAAVAMSGADPESLDLATGFAAGRFSWRHVAAVAAGVFVIVIAAITVLELVIGKPISSLWGGDGGSGTSIGHVVRQRQPAPASPSPTPNPTTVPSPTTVPTAPPPTSRPTPTVTVTVSVPVTPPPTTPALRATPTPGTTP